MPRIRVLEKQVAELIAAGEVVERPSAVIKELVENAVDAGASVITVEIRRGGVSYMRVTDNGCGILPEDVPLAFLRHATSKVARQEDLDAIGTLGFRGEALASISAVARVELLTRAKGMPTGARYLCGGGEEPSLSEAGCPQGATIVVRDLFFNTPARMKFLKKDVTEGNAVAGVLDKLALSHPEVSFRFIRDGKEQLHTLGDSKLPSAIYRVYGREFASTLIPVDYRLEHVSVSGFTSLPSGSRPNRSMQNFFINGRFIRSRTAAAAVEEAYKGSIMVGKFPACVLHIQISPGAVDVNIHPAKLEVRFVNERPVFDAVYHAVRSALEQGDRPKAMEIRKPVVSPYAPVPEKKEQTVFPDLPAPRPTLTLRDSALPAFQDFTLPDPILRVLEAPLQPDFPGASGAGRAKRSLDRRTRKEAGEALAEHDEKPAAAVKLKALPDIHNRILGEAFGTYIIVEYSADQLMFIDKHAAHERLLYERLKAGHFGADAQALLEPVAVNLEKEEYSAVLSHLDALSQAGFEVSDFGAGTVLVRAAPLLLDGQDAACAVMEIAGYLAGCRTEITTAHMDWVYHNVACRAAVKAGDRTSRQELISLALELERSPQVRYCPHGRPVYILLDRREIEKQFGRI